MRPEEIDTTRFPEEPGVYLWKDADGKVLYVGKAGNLRARILSYRKEPDPRKVAMVAKAAAVECVIARSEKEALVLESSLIKTHRPRYNVRLTDDKRYPYLELTADPWPRIRVTRDLRGRGHVFGPFPDAGAARRTLQLIREAFKVRDCKELVPGGCLNYQMDLCVAPCIMATAERERKGPHSALALLGTERPSGPQEMERRVRDAYDRGVAGARRLLKGDADAVVGALTDEMAVAAERLEFERATLLRDRLQAVTTTLERQAIFSKGLEDRDAFVAVREGPLAVGVVVLQRNGNVVGQEHFFFRRAAADTEAEILAEFIPRYYEHLPAIPREILVLTPPAGVEAIEAVLAERRDGLVSIVVPQKGDKRRLLEMAEKNAKFKIATERLKRGETEATEELAELARALRLAAAPKVIECYDISHLGGTGVVASMVALENGRPAKARYRRFKIRVDTNDDFAAMEEVIGRRFSRAIREGETLPDLVLIDGGPQQLASATRALADLGVSVPVAALAKREEEVWLPGALRPADLPKSSPALMVLMRARDEAHRFAVDYQRRLRRRTFKESSLDDLPGVGPERKRALLATFGSPERVGEATVEELARVPGVGRALAERIVAHLARRSP